MRLRISTVLFVMLLVCGAFGLYMVKYKVQDLKKEVQITEKSLMEEKQNLHVAKAEWAFLTRPDRIRRLSVKYLSAKPMTSKQIVTLSSIPYNALAQDKSKILAAGNADTSLVKLVGGVDNNDGTPDE